MILECTPGSEVATARKSCIPTQKIAAAVVGLKSLPPYIAREADQTKFTIGELKALYDAVGRDGKDTISGWLANFFAVENN